MSTSGRPRSRPSGRRSDFRTKPVSDLKAMFDKDSKDVASKAFAEPGADYSKKATAVSSKYVAMATSKPTTAASVSPRGEQISKHRELSDKDKADFKALKLQLNSTGVGNLTSGSVDSPTMAVSKVYDGGQTYTATVETKSSKMADTNGKTEVKREHATSSLLSNLVKIRTRPDSLKQEPLPGMDNHGNKRSNSPSFAVKDIGRNSENKYMPGVARGWKGSGDSSNERSSPLETNEAMSVKFDGSSVGKVRNKGGTEVKISGFRSVSPVNKYSSDDSSNSSNLSPRGYIPRSDSNNTPRSDSNNTPRLDTSSPVTVPNSKTDVNKNVSNKNNNNKTDHSYVFKSREYKTKVPNLDLNLSKSDTKLSAVEQLNRDKHKIKLNRNSGSFSSDSEKGKRSPKVKSPDMKWMEKSRVSLDEFKQQKVVEKKVLTKTSSLDSNTSKLSPRQTNVTSDRLRSKIKRFNSSDKDSVDGTDLGTQKVQVRGKKSLPLDLRSNFAASRRISTDKFKDLQKGFENPSQLKEQSPVRNTKLKVEIKAKQILERKESFENPEILRRKSSEKREIVSPRESGKVLEKIQSLNVLEAVARTSPSLKRRSQSLPSSSFDGGSSEEWYDDVGIDHGPGYEDIQCVILRSDYSNEGDISSEADQIYEEISSATNKDTKVDKFNRVRSMAIKKRKKLTGEISIDTQTGTDGDVDSDSSGCSGIYEPIDQDADIRVAESESPTTLLPPALPPDRAKNTKKKKKKDGDKSKGLTGKLKQLYKGKSVDGDATNKLKAKNLCNIQTEENPVCNSDGTDTDGDLDPDFTSKMSGVERSRSDGTTETPPPVPPPLPPRHSVIEQPASGGDSMRQSTTDHTYYTRTSGSRLSGGKQSSTGRSSPPLPPRNRVSTNLNLDVVIPIAPGGATGEARNSGWPPKGKDSYLHGQMLNPTSPDLPYMDESSSSETTPSPSHSETSAPPLPSRPVIKVPLIKQDSYVCVDPPPDDPLTDSDYSLADEIRKELENRPISSAYMNPKDLSSVPPVSPHIVPPFDDVMRFQSQYDGEGLYIDLSDDQVYGTAGTRYKSKLESESLYQWYNTDKITRASRRKGVYSSFDGSSDEEDLDVDDEGGERIYEDMSECDTPPRGEDSADEFSKKKISTLEMFGKEGTILRMLWSEMPEVKDSGVLDTISPNERKLQEAMFEIVSSEATYLKSLNILINVFLLSDEFGSDMSNRSVLTRQERHVVFSNIGTIRDASEEFLSDLESRWQESVVLSDICDIMAKHAATTFEPYVNYCSNQTFQDRAVTILRKKLDFVEALKRLESHTDCKGLPMISFLLLPMQRVTRLPLLVDAICHRLDPVKDKDRHNSAIKALDALHKVTKRCNDGAKKMQQTEQMCLIAKQLDFRNKDMTQIPLISASRYLVKQGELTRIVSDTSSRLPFGKAKPGKQSTFVFLFNDMLLVTKKKSNQYVVTDYAQRNAIHIEVIDNPEKHTRLLPLGVPSGCKNLILLVMLENYDKKTVELVFSCNSMSDRARWLDAMTPVKVSDDQERIYEEWDCPQVQCLQKYVALEPDELGLDESDVVNVFKKLDDGWFEGERMRDGERGWFPAVNTKEIVNSHVRARNMRMRYRLMAATDFATIR